MSKQRLFIFIAIICSALCAFFYRPTSADLALGDLFLLLGGAALGVALWPLPQTLGAYPTTPDAPIRPVPLIIGVSMLVLLAERNGFLLVYRPLIDLLDIHAQFLLWLAGTALVAVGLAGLRWRDRPPIAQLWTAHSRAVGLVLALALAVRLVALEDSVHTYIDEFHIIRAIGDLRDQPYTALLKPFDEVATFTWIFPYLQTNATALLGSNMTGLRFMSALFGAGTVLALYALARVLFNKTVALGAMAVLATFPPHTHFSRLGLLLITDPLFGVLGLACLVRALQTQARRWYVLAGAFFGLLPYFSDGGELLFPSLALVFCGWLALFKGAKPRVSGLAWLVLTAFIISAPVYYTFYAIGQPIFGRLEQAGMVGFSLWEMVLSADGLGQLQAFFRQQVLPPLLHYVHYPDSSAIFYGGDTPLVLPVIVPLLLLGVWQAFWRLRGAGFLLLAWLLLTALGNALLKETTWSARYMPVAPALALLIALGAYYTLGRLARAEASVAAFAGLIGLVALTQTGYYFFQHLPRYREQAPPWPDYVDVAYRARDLPATTQSVMIHRPWTSGFHFPWMFRYWGVSVNFIAVGSASVTEAYLLNLAEDQDYAFFIEPEDNATVALLERIWDIAGPYYSPYNIPRHKQYRLYLAPASARIAPRPP